jgi:hypothetical protein
MRAASKPAAAENRWQVSSASRGACSAPRHPPSSECLPQQKVESAGVDALVLNQLHSCHDHMQCGSA